MHYMCTYLERMGFLVSLVFISTIFIKNDITLPSIYFWIGTCSQNFPETGLKSSGNEVEYANFIRHFEAIRKTRVPQKFYASLRATETTVFWYVEFVLKSSTHQSETQMVCFFRRLTNDAIYFSATSQCLNMFQFW